MTAALALLDEATDAGLSIRVDGERLVIGPAAKLTDAMRSALIEAKPELLALLKAKSQPYRLTKAEGDAAHAEPWDDAACARFAARVGQFLRRGIDATDTDDLAERLHLRDVQGDDRRICVECSHLAVQRGWQCRNAKAARVVHVLSTAIVTKLQRCPGFAAEEVA